MQTHIITITYRDCALTYGLSERDLREFVDLGLLQAAPDASDTIQDEPDHLARLARLHLDLGLSKESIDVVLAMRRRLLQLQAEVQLQRSRAYQLQQALHGTGPVFDADDWL